MTAPTALPRRGTYRIETSELADQIGAKMANARHTGNHREVLEAQLRALDIAVPAYLAGLIIEELPRCTRASNEEEMASMAVETVLTTHLGANIEIKGWHKGVEVTVPTDSALLGRTETVTLTGKGCPVCKTMPMCYGRGFSGTRCTDMVGCGHLNGS